MRHALLPASGAALALLLLALPESVAAAPEPVWPEPVWPEPVWIDADPACDEHRLGEVDDCWALVLAFRSPEIAIRGVSTVFGNTDGATAFAIASALTRRFAGGQGGGQGGELPAVFRGAEEGGGRAASAASRALGRALERERLTVIALGPLTNVATVIAGSPELIANIGRVVAVAGRRPGAALNTGANPLVHFHDLNFRKDPEAARIVLESGVPLVLLPFEAARKVTIGRADLARLAAGGAAGRWLAAASAGWIGAWERWLLADGFHPFDSLAVGYVTTPALFTCETVPARITQRAFLGAFHLHRDLEVSHDFVGAPPVNYCFDVNPRFKARLISRVAGLGTETAMKGAKR